MSRALKPILLMPHIPDCAYFDKGCSGFGQNPWCIPKHEYLPVDVLGRRDKRRSSACLVFQCNDTRCSARMAVVEYQALRILGFHNHPIKSIGAPKETA